MDRRQLEFSGRGGDEFALFFNTSSSTGTIEAIVRSFQKDVTRPFVLGGDQIFINVSLGISEYPLQDIDAAIGRTEPTQELMRRTNCALQSAKKAGRGAYRLYDSGTDNGRNRITLRQSLRRAMRERQFHLLYQPLVDLESGAIIGAEALVRWDQPDLGLQLRDEFIPLAESSGLIVQLGDWILHEAMRQAVEWQRSGIRALKIAINISAVQLRDPTFVDGLAHALASIGARAGQFKLELTETVMLDGSPAIIDTLNAIKRMGFGLAIDDFGTGHASFQYLREFPVSEIKIDQVFVRNLGIEANDTSIVRNIISLAKSLRLDVVAEGIETASQRALLREVGCKIGQGYFFSRPLRPEVLGDLLREGSTLPAEH